MRRRRASETAKTTAVRAPFPPVTGKRDEGAGHSRLSPAAGKAFFPGADISRPLFPPAAAQKGASAAKAGAQRATLPPERAVQLLLFVDNFGDFRDNSRKTARRRAERGSSSARAGEGKGKTVDSSTICDHGLSQKNFPLSTADFPPITCFSAVFCL